MLDALQRPGVVHSDFVCRLGGLPVAALQRILTAEGYATAQCLLDLEESIAQVRGTLSEALYEAIGAASDPVVRGALIRMRRDVFNDRTLLASRVADVSDALSADVASELDRLCSEHATAAALRARLEDAVTADLSVARESLQRAVCNEDLRRGIALSSPALLAGLRQYARADPKRMHSRVLRIERGLLRYFSRMASKGTPFATFCAVVRGSFEGREDAQTDAAEPTLLGSAQKQSFVRLNKRVASPLWEALISCPAIREQLRVRTNSTLASEHGALRYLSGKAGTETFSRLKESPAVGLVLQACASADAPSFGSLRDTLLAHPALDSSREATEAFLAKLLDIGLLVFERVIPEQDPDWDLALVAFLLPFQEPVAQTVVEALGDARKLATDYAVASAEDRASLTEQLRARLDECLGALGVGPLLPDTLPLYEDATASLHAVIRRGEGVERALEALRSLLSTTARLAAPRDEQATMRAFFDQFYGATRGSVPLLTFYEDYYREHYKDRKARMRRNGRGPHAGTAPEDYNPFDLQDITTRREGLARVRSVIEMRIAQSPHADRIDLSAEDIALALQNVAPGGERPLSWSVFANMVPPEAGANDWQLVLHNASALAGYGKYFSRFLYMLDPALLNGLQLAAHSLTHERLAEISGDGDFNGNFHPKILPWEIEYPSMATAGASDRRMACTELVVEQDESDPNGLQLTHQESGERVWTVDLSFQNAETRPPLHQLLALFTPVSMLALPALGLQGTPTISPLPGIVATASGARREHDELPSGKASEEALTAALEPVKYLPRIVYENAVVLSRRRWRVPSDQLPLPTTGESSSQFYLRVLRWQRRHGLPDCVYIRFLVGPALQGPPSATAAAPSVPRPQRRRRGNHRKPQFIDCRSALLVDLFGREAEILATDPGIRFDCLIEEALPALSDGFAHGEERYVAECLLQVDCPMEGSTLPGDSFLGGRGR